MPGKKTGPSMREVYERTRGPAPSRQTPKKSYRVKSYLMAFTALSLLAGAAISYPLLFKKNPKIGYVNATHLAVNLGLLDQARKVLSQSRQKWDQELLVFHRELDSSIETLEIKKQLESEAAVRELQNNIHQKRQKLKKQLQKIEYMSTDLEKKLKSDLVEKLKRDIQDWGDKNGYDVLHSVSSRNKILDLKPELDVTRELQKDLVASR